MRLKVVLVVGKGSEKSMRSSVTKSISAIDAVVQQIAQ